MFKATGNFRLTEHFHPAVRRSQLFLKMLSNNFVMRWAGTVVAGLSPPVHQLQI